MFQIAWNYIIYIVSFLVSLSNWSSGIAYLNVKFWLLGFKICKASIYLILWYSIIFACFSNAFPSEEYVNFARSIICLWLKGSISSPARYSYLSIYPHDDADIAATSL